MRLRNLQSVLVSFSIFALAACTPKASIQPQAFDFKDIGRIEMQVVADDPAVLPSDIVEVVTKNLNAWKYPVHAKDGQPFSHVLKATVGTITHGTTPPGFSFSSGNSDPRALEYQKADVLPIDCQLTAIANPLQTRELNLGFAANSSEKHFLATEKLADHISTACFNLLTDVKWPLNEKKVGQSSTIKSSDWIPEIRIEDKMTTEDPITAPVVPPSTTPTTSVEKESKAPVSSEDTKVEESKKDEPKIRIQRDEPRRQIIIHNQGAPVILEFGYERR